MKTFKQYNKKREPQVGDVYKIPTIKMYTILIGIEGGAYKFVTVNEQEYLSFGTWQKNAADENMVLYHMNIVEFLKNNIHLMKSLIFDDIDNYSHISDMYVDTFKTFINDLKKDEEIQLLIESEELGLL